MISARALLLGALACAALPAAALEEAQWPPPAATVERMRSLQEALRDPQSTPAEREAAREELSGLLKSPAGQARGRSPGEKPARPARAAIDPFPSVVRPTEIHTIKPPPAEGVAQLEVIAPPKPIVNPHTGSMLVPTPRFAIDARTGSVLHEIPGGYVDPRTGQVVPR